MNRILVIGATGNVGRQVVSQLPAEGMRVRALARNPHTAALPPQVDLVRGDLADPETLEECLKDGVDAVFLVWTAPPAAVAPALERIVRHSPRIVFLSSPYKTPHPFFQGGQPNPIAPMHAEIERLIETSGRQWTFLRPGMLDPLRIEEISPDQARRELLTLLPAPVLNMLLSAWAGAIGQPAFLTSTVAGITGTPPRTFRERATDHAAEFRP